MEIKYYAYMGVIFIAACASQIQTANEISRNQSINLTIVAGQTMFVEANFQDGKIQNLNQVDNISNPNTTMTLKFTQSGEGENVGMMLSVHNPFGNPLKFHIDMVDYSEKRHKTSSCPVQAGASIYESWPHRIPKLIITNIHFASKKESNQCIY